MSSTYRPARLTACVFACLFLIGAGQAASTLHFARIDLTGDAITGVAIVNPNATGASVVLTAYGPDGDPADLPKNPVTILIPAGSQYARTAAEIFEIPSGGESVAWMEATSDADDLTGFFLFLNAEVSIFDGAKIPEPQEELLFTEVHLGIGESTELNIANPNDVAANIELTLYAPGGSSTRSLKLAPRGVIRLDAATYFSAESSTQGTAASFVTAASDSPLVGFEVVYTAQDILGLSATARSEQLDRLVFPQLAVLQPFRTELSVVNLSDKATIATLTAYQPSGEPFQPAAGNNPVNVELPPLSARRYDLETLFGFEGDQTLDGWLEVRATGPSINGSLTFHVTTIGSVASVASVAQGSDRALFSHIATSLGFFTGLAILNPGSLTANARIVALRPDGSVVGGRSVVLRPGQRISDVLTNLISGSSGLAGGFIWVESDLPLYLTSLFGSLGSGVLANIPPQPVPDEFQPEPPESALAISPALAVLQPGRVQEFSLSGITGGPVNWAVEGAGSGSTDFGSIDEQGRYTAPNPAPAQLPVSISASTETQASGASVDILSKSRLTQNLGVVQSVAYLQSARRLYVAERQGTDPLAKGHTSPAVADSTSIVDVTDGPPLPVASFNGEVITAMLPYLAPDDREYLILANETGGVIIRLDPVNGTRTEVLSGLDQPSALVIDEADGQLLVAEAEQVREFSLDLLSTGLTGSEASPAQFQSTPGGTGLFEAFRGRLAIDQCSGNVYASVPSEGRILEFVRRSGGVRVLVSGLQDPGALLGFYRRGMSCPAAFHLLVAERGAGRIGIVTPSDGGYRPWADAAEPSAVILLPEDNPITPGSAVLVAESGAEEGELSIVPLPGIYLATAANLPQRFPLPPCSITQLTTFADGQAESVALSGDGRRIVFSTSQDLLGQNPDGNEELFLFDRDGKQLSQITDSRDGRNTSALLDHSGSHVVFGSTAGFGPSSPPGPRIVLLDLNEGSRIRLTDKPGVGFSIDASGTIVAFASRADPLGSNPDGNSEIFLLRTGDPFPSQVTQTLGSVSGNPALSGDGRHLAFLSDAPLAGDGTSAGLSLYLMDLDAGTLRFVSAVATEFRPADSRPPLIDREGRRIIFESDLDLTGQNPLGRSAVFVVDVEANQIRQISSGAGTTRLDSLSADGMLAALTSDTNVLRINPDRNAEIFLLDLSGGNPAQVTRSRRAWNGSARLAVDGDAIVFISNADYVGENSAHRVQIFGGTCRPRD
ncbi:MAG: hypothetical protein WAO20_12710 [Acidobacteriota bacterium]